MTMKKIYPVTKMFIAIIMICTMNVSAQKDVFTKVFYDNSGWIVAHGATKSYEGNFYICGRKDGIPVIMKMYANGIPDWIKHYGDTDGYFDAVEATGDSCILAAGRLEQQGVIVAKLNDSGDTLWTRLVAFEVAYFEKIAIHETSEHGAIVLAGTNQYPDPDQTTVIKFDPLGNVQWAKTFSAGIGNAGTCLRTIRQIYDGGFIASGIVERPYPAENIFFLMKLSPDGHKEWIKALSDPPPSSLDAFDVLIQNDGCLFLNSHQIVLIKTDFSGNFIWGKQTEFSIGNEFNYSDASPKLHPVANGGYIFRGSIGMMKIDAAGNELWTKELYLYPVDVIPSDDGGYMVVGNGPIWMPNRPSYNPEVGVIKTDSQGNSTGCESSSGSTMGNVVLQFENFDIAAFTAAIDVSNPGLTVTEFQIARHSGCVDIIGAVDEFAAKGIQISAFPNPTGGIFRVDARSDDMQLFERLDIYDSMGQRVMESTDPEIFHESINLTTQPDGIYFIRGIFGNRKASCRVIIQR